MLDFFRTAENNAPKYLSSLTWPLPAGKAMWRFYSASALLAMQSAVLARGILSARPSVRRSRSGIVPR